MGPTIEALGFYGQALREAIENALIDADLGRPIFSYFGES
jgi:hypothetical protein